MFFNSFHFLLVFPLLFLAYYIIPARNGNLRNGYLLAVSYLLYMNFRPAYALVLLGVTLTTYLTARLLNRHRGGVILSIGLIISLLPLLLFKYYNFLNDSCFALLSAFGLRWQLPGLNWAVPIGISFFTFQAIAYVVDVRYGRAPVERNLLHYALFVAFFPSIVSGPINRAALLLPQIKGARPYFDNGKVVEGLRLLLWGMFLKVVVADRMGLYVDKVFETYAGHSSASCILAAALYSVQIYADFAGYTLMAIGIGKTLGFDLAENFRRPYLAVSVTDFWHRWHISLSTWLKDCIYIPLGGSRCSKLRNYLNIIITFLVSGMWHGANWTFIVWGLLHGIFQVIEKALRQQQCKYGAIGRGTKIIITFVLVTIAWIFFRMPTLADAFGVLHQMASSPVSGILKPANDTLAFILMGLMTLVFKDLTDEYFPERFRLLNSRHVVVRWLSYLVLTATIISCGVLDTGQFIYANF